jgi:hypothetical protein
LAWGIKAELCFDEPQVLSRRIRNGDQGANWMGKRGECDGAVSMANGLAFPIPQGPVEGGIERFLG